MNVNKSNTMRRLAEELVTRLTIELEASGRHVHLSWADVETLFGADYRLNQTKDLSQPGQFACAERVTPKGPRGSLKSVVILGPEHPKGQVEISPTDAVALRLTPPMRLSDDTESAPGLTLRHGGRVPRLSRGPIMAKRYIHMTSEGVAHFGVVDRQRVCPQCFTSHPLVFQGVGVRVSPQFFTVVHIDYDEASACGFQKNDQGVILKWTGEAQVRYHGREVDAPFDVTQMFYRRQSLRMDYPKGTGEGPLGGNAGCIHCTQADEGYGGPTKDFTFYGGAKTSAYSFQKSDRGVILK